ncbi:MAG: hypothetical protein HGA86_08130, partial [Anaerolineaceae bacterium]|nr:hypothetical protein [Anaerolineaceae bacterium]
ILSLALIFILCKPSGKLRIKFLYLLFYPVFFGLILGNFAVSIGTILVFIFLFMVEVPLPSRKVQIAAGILLAWATAKPQFLWFFAAFFVLYSLKHRLKVFLISFFTSLAALIAISFVMVPNWLAQWVGRIFEYAGYVKSRLTVTHLLMQFLPENVALVLTYILAAAAGMFSFWLLLRWWRGQLSPFSILAWAGFTTYLLHPHGIAYEQISFLAPLLIWAANQKQLRQPSVLVFWVGALVFSWVAFAVGKWVYHPVDMWPLLLNGVFVAWVIKKDPKRSLVSDPQIG